MGFPKWRNMPEPIGITSLSWEDLYQTALDNGLKPTKKQMIEIMESIDSLDFDCSLDFWQNCEALIDKYLNSELD